MRIVALVNGEGFTKAQYDQLMQNMNVENNPPKGMVTHIATFDKKGIRVTDVWESEQDFNNFKEKRLMAGLDKVGFKERLKVEVYPLHLLIGEERLHRQTSMH
jgi:hypothetical protein